MQKQRRKRTAPDEANERPTKKPSSITTNLPILNHVEGRTNLKGNKSQTQPQKTSKTEPQKQLQVYVCGEGGAGELGLGAKNATEVKAPRLNPNLSSVLSVAAGGMHAIALATPNKLLTWGINDHGTLGRDTTWDGGLKDADMADSDSDDDVELNPKESTPAAVPVSSFPSGVSFVQVAAGDSTTFALTSTGDVYGWGTFRDHNGVYGFTLDADTGEIVKIQKTPIRVRGLQNIRQISVGSDFALALDEKGAVFAWGCGQQNELGHRLIERRRARALLPASLGFPRKTKLVSIHAAANHAFAIDSNGDTWAWGSNNFGQTGIGSGAGQGEATIAPPQRIPALIGKHMKMVQGGSHHSIGVSGSGECLVWGRLDGGQSGLDLSKLLQTDPEHVVLDSRTKPRILSRPTPVPIPPVVHVAAGSDHCLAITAEGKAYSWGFNATYQCGQGNDDDILVAKLMEGKAIREKKIVWAGAGGQYSMLASALTD